MGLSSPPVGVQCVRISKNLPPSTTEVLRMPLKRPQTRLGLWVPSVELASLTALQEGFEAAPCDHVAIGPSLASHFVGEETAS